MTSYNDLQNIMFFMKKKFVSVILKSTFILNIYFFIQKVLLKLIRP